MYQVSWFSKKKGYGFVIDDQDQQYFVHHSDIQVPDGFRYLEEGEYIKGEKQTLDDGKVKISQITAPLKNGKLMCEIESQRRRRVRTDNADHESSHSPSDD